MRVEQLVVGQMVGVQRRHPNVELQRDPCGQLWVRGSVGFSIEWNSRTVQDAYEIEIRVPADYPRSPPSVYETDGRIPPEFGHFMKAGNFCLEAPVEVRRRFALHQDLLHFIDEQVVPYLFAFSYKRQYGKLPFGDRNHGALGLHEYYSEFFQTTGVESLKLLKCLAEDRFPPLMACPCGSKQKLRDCHLIKLEELRPHLSPGCFEAELRQIVAAARRADIELPLRSIMTKRMKKRERRDRISRSQKRRTR